VERGRIGLTTICRAGSMVLLGKIIDGKPKIVAIMGNCTLHITYQ